MGWYLDGRVSVVVGTHTHVPTADARVLPRGTAYVTDVGMTGPHDSVIGVERAAILQRFLTALPQRFETAAENPRLNAVLIVVNDATGQAESITRLDLSVAEVDALAAQPAPVR
jgi:calcineurin-like phosphoesterase